jgi:VIT1/CCC1 family predicted Fe2+/Mn2+ transporter
MSRLHSERHNIGRIGWLRAGVLGANDGIVSTSSLIVGVAAAAAGKSEVLLAGFAGLAAGALSMAAGAYVSVSSQSDTESADLARERWELAEQPGAELHELTEIYRGRGLSAELAGEVARQLTATDPLAAHARDELAISELTTARPLQAAWASAATFSVGAALPLAAAWFAPLPNLPIAVTVASLLFLAALGALGAGAGGAPIGKAILRVMFWGALAMAVTAGVGRIFGTVI